MVFIQSTQFIQASFSLTPLTVTPSVFPSIRFSFRESYYRQFFLTSSIPLMHFTSFSFFISPFLTSAVYLFPSLLFPFSSAPLHLTLYSNPFFSLCIFPTLITSSLSYSLFCLHIPSFLPHHFTQCPIPSMRCACRKSSIVVFIILDWILICTVTGYNTGLCLDEYNYHASLQVLS